jgi:hypothetical protein
MLRKALFSSALIDELCQSCGDFIPQAIQTVIHHLKQCLVGFPTIAPTHDQFLPLPFEVLPFSRIDRLLV